jgi:hypothetical protein
MERVVLKSRGDHATDRWSCGRARWLAGAGCVLALFGAHCSAPQRVKDVSMDSSGPVVQYRFPLPDGSSIGSADHSGRWTVILFLTTYDPVSQAIALRLDDYQHTRTPRINVLAVALEPPQNAPLVSVYRETLAIGYPVALADQDTLDGHGPFGDVRAVPALVLLDRQSRVVRRGVGVSVVAEIEAALNESAKSPK